MEHSSALFLGQQGAVMPATVPPRAEAHYRALFMVMGQACCIIEQVAPAPGQPSDYRYMAVNPASTRHSDPPDATGQTLRQVVPGVEPRIVAVFDEALKRVWEFNETSCSSSVRLSKLLYRVIERSR